MSDFVLVVVLVFRWLMFGLLDCCVLYIVFVGVVICLFVLMVILVIVSCWLWFGCNGIVGD